MNLFFSTLLLAISSLTTLAQTTTEEPAKQLDESEEIEIEIVEQSYVNQEKTGLTVLLRIDPAIDLEATNVETTIHATAGTEEELASSLPIHRLETLSLAEITDDAGVATLEIPLRVNESLTSEGFFLPEPGVYPLTMTFSSEGSTLRTIKTFFINPSAEEEAANENYILLTLNETTINETIEILEKYPQIPLTLVVPYEVQKLLQENVELAERLSKAAQQNLVTPAMEPDIELSGLLESEQENFYFFIFNNRIEELKNLGLNTDQQLLLLNQTLSPAMVTALARQGITTRIQQAETTANPFFQKEGLATITTLTAPAGQTKKFSTATNATEATVAISTFLTVNESQINTLIFQTAEPEELENLTELFSFISNYSTLANSLKLPNRVAATTEKEYETRENKEVSTSDITVVTKQLIDYRRIYLSGETTPGTLETRLLQTLKSTANNQAVELQKLRSDVERELNAIALQPQSFNLVSRNADIPITIVSTAEGDRQVILRLNSDKIALPEKEQNVIIKPGENLVNVTVDIRSLGVSSLAVEIVTPIDGSSLTQTQLLIRSTFIPGLGMTLSGGALFFLLAWWYLSYKKNKRQLSPAKSKSNIEGNNKETDARA